MVNIFFVKYLNLKLHNFLEICTMQTAGISSYFVSFV